MPGQTLLKQRLLFFTFGNARSFYIGEVLVKTSSYRVQVLGDGLGEAVWLWSGVAYRSVDIKNVIEEAPSFSRH